MAFTVPTFDELTSFGVSVGRGILDMLDWSRWKTAWKWFRVVAAIGTDIHANVDSAKDDLLPDRASEKYLARFGKMLQVDRKEATPARKDDALRIYGDEGADVVGGETLTHQGTGLRFQVTEAKVIGLGDTYMTVSVIAIDTGAQTRLSKGEFLFFDETPDGCEEKAELVLDLDIDGDDQEGVEAWRQRILDKLGDPPLGGARSDYSTWAKQMTGVDTAYPYPLRRGMGSVDLAALHPGDGEARLLSGGELTELQARVDSLRPVATKPFRVLIVDAQLVDVSLAVAGDGEPGHGWYWTDEVPLEVASYNPATRLLTFTVDRPDDMAAGMTICVAPDAGDEGGRELVIEALSGDDAVILEVPKDIDSDPIPDPVAGDLVYSGGPLVAPLREAVRRHFRKLGPSNPDARHYGPWEANVRPEAFGRNALVSTLKDAAKAAAKDSVEKKNLTELAELALGAKFVDVEAPSSTVEPTDDLYPDDATVHLCIPGMVLVHRKW